MKKFFKCITIFTSKFLETPNAYFLFNFHKKKSPIDIQVWNLKHYNQPTLVNSISTWSNNSVNLGVSFLFSNQGG